jgi:hypothetical protein
MNPVPHGAFAKHRKSCNNVLKATAMTKILLLNFTESEAAILLKAGYNVERGFLGVYEQQKYLPFKTPHPIYEYDIAAYTSTFTPELRNEFSGQQNLLGEKGCLDALTHFTGTPSVRISFVGDYTGLPRLLHGGLSFVSLESAEKNVSMFLDANPSPTFAIPEMHQLVSGFKRDIAHVGQYISGHDTYPFYHMPVLVSRNGEQVAAYGTTYENSTLPRYVVLPQLKSNGRALLEILQTLEKVWPALFPERIKNAWIQTDEFLLPDERAKNKEIEEKVAEALAAVEKLRGEQKELKKENSFIRQLLVATEDVKLDLPERLSSLVKKALEFLGFSVTDIDQQTKSAIKKEDFWVADGEFFAITEVTGTANTNPKVKEFHDILGRITTIYKRKTDLIPKDVANVSGLLVLNYDCERHPSRRPKAYSGDFEHIVESARDQDISLLSTVELHKILVAVKEGRLTKEKARSLLKKSGRIEYSGTDSAPNGAN